MNDSGTPEHDLGQQLRISLFEGDIVSRKLSGASRRQGSHQRALLLGGQPAAGKSTLIKSALRSTMRHATVIGTDEMRPFHPCYWDLLRGNVCDLHGTPGDYTTADFNTDPDSRQWAIMALEWLVDEKRDIIFDGTLSRLDSVRLIINRLKGAGYIVKVVFVATPKAVSLLANLKRYTDERIGLAGRLCSRDNHNTTYQSVLETAQWVDDEGSVDTALVQTRTGDALYVNKSLGSGTWSEMPPYTVDTINAERARPRHSVEIADFVGSFETLRALLEPESSEWREWFTEIRMAARDIIADEEFDSRSSQPAQ